MKILRVRRYAVQCPHQDLFPYLPMRDESIVQMFDEGNVRKSAVSIIVSQRREMLLPRHSEYARRLHRNLRDHPQRQTTSYSLVIPFQLGTISASILRSHGLIFRVGSVNNVFGNWTRVQLRDEDICIT